MGKNEKQTDFLHKISNYFVCIFNKVSMLRNFMLNEKTIEKIICMDLGHQISKCNSISEMRIFHNTQIYVNQTHI